MKSLSDFTILFDNPHATFYCGQHVTGRIFIRVIRQKKLRGIELRFSGATEVHWTQDKTVKRDGQSRKETDHYWSQENYFENKFFVIGGPSGEMTLAPGVHYFSFRLILPSMIPSSFEGQWGHVRYTCKGVIIRPGKFNHESKVAFTVINPLDLNSDPNLQTPQQMSVDKYLCCCCCRSGPIALIVNMGIKGFVPGQNVQAVVEVDNPTDKKVTIRCSLMQKVTFTATCHSSTQKKEVNNVVSMHRMGYVQRNSSITKPVDMQIPAIPTSFLQNCNYIDISYMLQITGIVSGAFNNINIDVPIVIGTIPLRTQFPSLVPRSDPVPSSVNYQPPMNSREFEPSAPSHPFPNYPEMPPPTYEECVCWKANIRSEEDSEFVEGPLEFAPRYPIYTFK